MWNHFYHTFCNLSNFHKTNSDLSDLDDFFFLTDPHQLIYSHFPEDAQWQLLTTPTTPYTPQQFLSTPYLKPEFFKLSLSLDKNHQKFIGESNTHCISLGHNGRVGFSFKLHSKGSAKDFRRYVFQEIQDNCVRYFVRPPTSGSYYLHVFATNVFSGFSCDFIGFRFDGISIKRFNEHGYSVGLSTI